MSSRMGNTVTVEVFGESHARAIGMTLEGIPAGVRIDEEKLHAFMARRAPGRDATATARREADLPQFLCGIAGGVTTGAPITAIIENTNTRSADYSALCTRPRPSHADYAAYVKYGGHNDLRGGGHFPANTGGARHHGGRTYRTHRRGCGRALRCGKSDGGDALCGGGQRLSHPLG